MVRDRPVGELLREWRHRRGISQLDLAVQAEVSARHVSFVETGRTIPSSAMVLRLAEHLGVPLRERNRLLVAAGHAPIVRERPLDDPHLAPAREVLEQILRGHEPYPALVVDRRWNLLLANAAMDVFLEGVDASLLGPPINMMRLGLHPRGFAPRLRNLAQVRAYLLPRLARQVAQTGDAELSALYEELLSYGPAGDLGSPDPADIALPIRIRHRGAELCFINTVTTFGAAFDVTLEEIAVEAYFAADDDTARFFRAGADVAPAAHS
ncbi:helix-turn-helix domain-containing protein [Nonomuraea muscovyensis]|jgi:transcriptional regulator with XRE-family HTH domain|uniref:Transcriptional regulator with XRE-family HTH domain n=1 Tax=Nonomuraea muscovyensis TaxID=1124761 RepID=A0A7X0F1V3_9ACTN|nr:helix-turn-helix transcriptional regulator [Nonomuraea muscovyensis]MBB6350059.1 transcriptional regulator with XRE-family HTH domain [Nonomuraea muscovyensis]MDF2711028.1 transcriptional regulator [Nonomuraea muscovyensis]